MKVLITSDTSVPKQDGGGFALYRLTSGRLLMHPEVATRLEPLFERAGVTIEEGPPGHAVLVDQSREAFLNCTL